MDVETAIQAFASAGHDLPHEVLQWTLDHWDEAAPELLSVVERYTSGADQSDETASAVFFILYLAGEKQDTRVFSLLCRLAQDVEALEAALGDTATTFRPILISTYDGHLDTLKGLIEATEADEFVRAGALQVLAYLTATGRVPRDETEVYLLRLYDTLKPQQESFVWSGWVLAIGLLGLEALSGVVRQAFGRGLIDPMVMGYDHFRRDLERTLADPARMAGFEYDQIGPLEDAIGELSSWYAFSDAAKEDQDRWATSPEDADLAYADTPLPFVDPFTFVDPLKGVGRNDPCPCGSGKKFKKCAWTECLSGPPCQACDDMRRVPHKLARLAVLRSALPRDANAEHDAAHGEHLGQVAQAQFVTQAPEHHEGDDIRRVLGPVQQRVGALIELLAARTTTEPAIALGGALGSLGHGLRPAFYTPHPRPPLFVRGGPMPDQVPSAKGSGASPDRTLFRALAGLESGPPQTG
jgi:uncharacterized protein